MKILNKMKKGLIIGISSIVVIIIISFNSITASSNEAITLDITRESSSNIIEVGSFSIKNTTEHYTLFKVPIYTTRIGTTWNLTITILSNSSSAVTFSLESNFRLDCWQGPEAFQVNPNQTHSEIYVAHCVSDEAPEFNFRYSLIETGRNAHGTYQITKIHSGYPVDVSTDLYIWDISAWLKSCSTSSSTIESSQPAPSYGLTVILCLITLINISLITIKRRRNRKQS